MWDDLKALPGWSWFDKLSWYSFLVAVAFVMVMVCWVLTRLIFWPLSWQK